MTGPRLTHEQRERLVASAMQSGRLRWQSRGARVVCTFCGRKGWSSGYWVDNCLLGHRFVCACGRPFASRMGLATHRRKTRTPAVCKPC